MSEAEPLPEGRYEITGEILSTKWYYSADYGDTLKMLVKLENGHRVYGTVPAALDHAELEGQTVTFTGTVKRSDSDESYGYFSRPTITQPTIHPDQGTLMGT